MSNCNNYTAAAGEDIWIPPPWNPATVAAASTWNAHALVSDDIDKCVPLGGYPMNVNQNDCGKYYNPITNKICKASDWTDPWVCEQGNESCIETTLPVCTGQVVLNSFNDVTDEPLPNDFAYPANKCEDIKMGSLPRYDFTWSKNTRQCDTLYEVDEYGVATKCKNTEDPSGMYDSWCEADTGNRCRETCSLNNFLENLSMCDYNSTAGVGTKTQEECQNCILERDSENCSTKQAEEICEYRYRRGPGGPCEENEDCLFGLRCSEDSFLGRKKGTCIK